MRIGDLDHLLIKLDAELSDDARYIDIADQIREIINNAPTVEPETTEKQAITTIINSGWLVKHDKELREKWEKPKGEWSLKGYEPFGRCNICNAICEVNKFCGNCGAEMNMRGKEE